MKFCSTYTIPQISISKSNWNRYSFALWDRNEHFLIQIVLILGENYEKTFCNYICIFVID